MTLLRRLRIPAVFCALAVLVCVLASKPYVEMSFDDDAPYILIVRHLAATGHIVYNGWPTAMIGWQLYLGAAFLKLFGASFTAVRMSTVFVAMLLAFLLQRTMVRAGIGDRNAVIGTLALVLSPLYLMLSVTFMTDISGLFAVVICIYGCLRALQAANDRSAIAWLAFAVACNAVCGSSRQIAWLGVLVMVPSTLWLLRGRRRVFLAGAACTLAGALFILGCMLWFKHQPYSLPEPLFVSPFPLSRPAIQLLRFYLDLPFLLLPIAVLFLPEVRKNRVRTLAILSVLLVSYLFLATYPNHFRGSIVMEPYLGDWVDVFGIFESSGLQGAPPLFITTAGQVLLTFLSIASLIGIVSSFLHRRRPTELPGSNSAGASPVLISWHQLCVVLLPYLAVYSLLIFPRAVKWLLLDRYTLGPLLVLLFLLIRHYQDRVHPNLPALSLPFIAITALYAVAITHNMGSFYRARLDLAAQLRSTGVPDTAVDNGWEYNYAVELQHAAFINDPRIVLPAHSYIAPPHVPAGLCHSYWYDRTPSIHPLYAISFSPQACYGAAPFAPVHYSRWLAFTPGTLYVVKYTEQSTPLPALAP